MKVTNGTMTKIDKGTKTAAVKSADGTEKTFEDTDNAAKDLAKETGKSMEKGTAYCTEEAGNDCSFLSATLLPLREPWASRSTGISH
jgi:hypothetical protein